MSNPVKGYRFAAHMDAPAILDASVPSSNIPGSGDLPLQVIASLPRLCQRVICDNETGRYIGIYVGPVGFEEYVCLASGIREELFPAGSRISIRNFDPDPITERSLFMEFQYLWG